MDTHLFTSAFYRKGDIISEYSILCQSLGDSEYWVQYLLEKYVIYRVIENNRTVYKITYKISEYDNVIKIIYASLYDYLPDEMIAIVLQYSVAEDFDLELFKNLQYSVAVDFDLELFKNLHSL